MGLPGTGKSNFLIKAARTNVQNGKNVVYISLEMSQDKIAARMDSQIGRIDMKHIPDYTSEGATDRSPNETEMLIKDRIECLFSGLIKRPKLIIKQFPAGQADVNTVRAFLSQVNLDGFKPDLLLLDYVGEMKDFDGIKIYESRQKLVRDLRALAVEEQICVITAMQPNRAARDQEQNAEIDDSTLGDSFGQARPLDSLWSINQNRQEKEAGVGRIFVVKNRDGQSRKVVYFKQDRECLDFDNITSQEYGLAMSRASDNKNEQVKIEDMFPRKPKQSKDTLMPDD
jgi:replicative DNA helicase